MARLPGHDRGLHVRLEDRFEPGDRAAPAGPGRALVGHRGRRVGLRDHHPDRRPDLVRRRPGQSDSLGDDPGWTCPGDPVRPTEQGPDQGADRGRPSPGVRGAVRGGRDRDLADRGDAQPAALLSARPGLWTGLRGGRLGPALRRFGDRRAGGRLPARAGRAALARRRRGDLRRGGQPDPGPPDHSSARPMLAS